MAMPDASRPAIDLDVLESLFAMGDDALRAALSAQLWADFTRLRQALQAGGALEVGRAAHELKGLAATVGAQRLADMAQSVDAVAEGMPPAMLAALVAPLVKETDAVLDFLAQIAKENPA